MDKNIYSGNERHPISEKLFTELNNYIDTLEECIVFYGNEPIIKALNEDDITVNTEYNKTINHFIENTFEGQYPIIINVEVDHRVRKIFESRYNDDLTNNFICFKFGEIVDSSRDFI